MHKLQHSPIKTTVLRAVLTCQSFQQSKKACSFWKTSIYRLRKSNKTLPWTAFQGALCSFLPPWYEFSFCSSGFPPFRFLNLAQHLLPSTRCHSSLTSITKYKNCQSKLEGSYLKFTSTLFLTEEPLDRVLRTLSSDRELSKMILCWKFISLLSGNWYKVCTSYFL